MKKVIKIICMMLVGSSFLGNFKIYGNEEKINSDICIKSNQTVENLPIKIKSKKRVLIISGIPAAGKSSYTERISRKLNLPFISKDNLKEKFLEILHQDIIKNKMINSGKFSKETCEKIKLYTPAVYNVLFNVSENLMKTDMPFIIESNFTPSHENELNKLLEKYGYEALNISFIGDMETLQKRFCKRDMSPERHPIHKLKSKMYYDIEVFKKIFLPMKEFKVGNKITVDTSEFSSVDYESLDELVVHFFNNMFNKNREKNFKKKDLSFLQNLKIAHRGLHDITKGIPENSIIAFKNAIQNEKALEFDLHLLKDGKIVVFHDDNLKRMTGVDKYIDDCTYEEIKNLKLLNTEEKIPLFKDVLDLINGKVLANIEFKYRDVNNSNVGKLEQAASEILDNYKGKFIVQSFNPYSIKWFKENRPNFIRGQLAYDFKDIKEINIFKKFILQHMLLSYMTEPDFVSYDLHSISKKQADDLKKFDIPLLLWTVRSERDLELAKKYGNSFIYEKINF